MTKTRCDDCWKVTNRAPFAVTDTFTGTVYTICDHCAMTRGIITTREWLDRIEASMTDHNPKNPSCPCDACMTERKIGGAL